MTNPKTADVMHPPATGAGTALTRRPAPAGATYRRVLIESPFAGDTERNVRYLRAALRDCLLRGEAPFASHGLYTLPGVLDDTVPAERALGIEAGLIWGSGADVTVVYTDLGISEGMKIGIERAYREGRPVTHRSLREWRGGGDI